MEKVQKCSSLEQAISKWAGCRPKKFNKTKKWGTAWGKDNKFRADFSPDGKSAYVYDWTKRLGQFFVLEGHNFIEKNFTSPPKPIQDFSTEFNALQKIDDHPYLQYKKVKSHNVDIRTKNGKDLIIPFYSIKESLLCGWQVIYSGTEGWLKVNKNGCTTKDVFLPIGSLKDDTIFIAEGFATCLSIHKITNNYVLCTFGKHNLDSVARYVLNKHKTAKVVLCLDNDGKSTHETKVKDNRLVILKPDLEGKDFNDVQNNDREKLKLQMIDPNPICYPISGLIKPTVHVDENGLVLRAYLGCLSGEKASMKSRGIISYLLNEGNRILYFSGGENTPEQIQKILLALNKEPVDCLWFNMLNKEWLNNLPAYVKKFKNSTILEDPPCEEWATQQETRKQLMLRAEIAKTLNVAWIFTRNLSKAKYDTMLGNVSGYGLITNIPRFVLGTFPIEIGHKFREGENDPKISLMQSLVCNEGPPPDNGILLRLKTADIESNDNTGKRASVAYCAPNSMPAVTKPEKWVLAPKSTLLEDETREFKTLHFLSGKKEGVERKELISKLFELHNVKKRQADKHIKQLKEDGFIKGGGKAKKAPYTITEKGEKVLNEPTKEKKSLKETLVG